MSKYLYYVLGIKLSIIIICIILYFFSKFPVGKHTALLYIHILVISYNTHTSLYKVNVCTPLPPKISTLPPSHFPTQRRGYQDQIVQDTVYTVYTISYTMYNVHTECAMV